MYQKMSQLCYFWIVTMLSFHQYLQICSSFSSSSSYTPNLFEKWSEEHGKSYSSDQEKQYRIKVFEENYDYITQHNNKANSSYTLSLNPFADLTHHEFKEKYLLGQPRPSVSPPVLESTATAKPITVGICASHRPFQFYSKGIFTGPCCETLDHSVLIVGDDSRNGIEYWKVKNSWGEKWGINGYMNLEVKRNGNSCGINNEEIITNYSTNSKSNCFPFSCPRGETCCCHKRVFFQCVNHGCCPAAYPICCKPDRTCCTLEHPLCDEVTHKCYTNNGSSTTLAKMSMIGDLSTMLGN